MIRVVNNQEAKTTTEHQAKMAYVYVRQSTLGQVSRHQESTNLQYQLAEYAAQLGWPPERIKIIDEDLGKSGSSAAERQGFQQILAEIGLGRVGLVISLDASRLARNNSDWHQLLELCSVFGTLIADSEKVYDPGLYTDRMLLGLSGIMSEAELHQLKRRLHAGAWNKAKRGELNQALPVGLVRLQSGEVIFHPDEEVEARIRLVFAKFAELKVANAVRRYFQQQVLLLPSRPLKGPAPHDVVWRPARSSAILGILQNPAYAGAYVYGRRTHDPSRRKPGHPRSGTVRVPLDKWPIVIQNAYPAYITWETFLANQKQLEANQNRYQEERHGAPRKGQALLQGVIRCGRCGALMRLRYSGPKGQFPVYECTYAYSQYGAPRCQEVRGSGLDKEVEQILLEALMPDKLSLAMDALEELEQEYTSLKRQHELHLERLQYEAERAWRQYDAVEPENRLVARSLEKRWEQKLRALEKGQQEHQGWLKQQQLTLTDKDRQDILALGQDLPKVWQAASTTAVDRKQILRCVIKEVIVDQKRVRGKVWFQINWQTGAVTEYWYKRRTNSYADHADLEQIEQRIRELHAQQKLDDEIAEALNAEGFQTTKLKPFNSDAVWFLRNRMGLPPVIWQQSNPDRWEDGTYSVQGAAKILGVFPGTVYKWLQTGRLEGHQLRKGTPWKIVLTPEKEESLQKYLQRARRSKREAS
jgi:excisionase family DNA binding protein